MQVDLRSDTFTLPTPGMLDAMGRAAVGDDVFGEDPSVNLLEETVAEMFGKESALFFPSGTMANQVAIKCHTQPGDEVICEAGSHIFYYEGGGIALNSGCQPRTIMGDRGRITAAQVEECINPDDVHRAPTRLVSLENTANRGGGSCYEISEMQAIRELCNHHKIALHLDGARLWNAMVATETSASVFGKIFHSVSVCFSKGLGAPVGSALVGDKAFIQKARRFRKVFGGGMRQAGYLAAAALYAVKNNIPRLADDHYHATMIARALSEKSFVGRIWPVETNIIIFEVKDYSPHEFCDQLKQNGVYCLPVSSTTVRMVTHLNITPSMADHVVQVVKQM